MILRILRKEGMNVIARKKPAGGGMNRGRPKGLVIASARNPVLAESKHKQIVEGACRVFFKKGYHPATIREIAAACGMSMGQLYHYISSKDDVLYLVHEHMQAVWRDYLGESRIEEIEDPVERLRQALHQTIRFAVENKRLLQFVYTESKYLDRKHLRVVLEMDKENVIGFWRQQIEAVSRRKPLKGDPDFLASLLAYLNVFLPLRGWTLEGRSLEESIESLRDFMLRGLGVLR
jgi:AcrR family transcriptional regulator